MVRPERKPPRAFSPKWPDTPCTDPVAEVARHLALRLDAARAGRSLRAVAEITKVDYSTIGDIIGGRSWPDLATVAKLEIKLDVDLWPGRIGRSTKR